MKTEKSGTILSVNAFAHQDHSQMEFNVLNVPLDNFMPTEDATVQMEPSSMESNVPLRLPINVSESQTPTGTELTVSASQDSQPTETHAIVMVSSWETIVKDAPQSQTQSGAAESVNVTLDMPMSTVFVRLLLQLALNAMSELSSTHNSKNVFHALMDVSHARLATIVLNADPTTHLMPRADFVLKFAVMEKDTLLSAMMETTLMVMDAARIATLKLDSHAMAVHQAPKIHAAPFSHQPFPLSQEANQDFTERSF